VVIWTGWSQAFSIANFPADGSYTLHVKTSTASGLASGTGTLYYMNAFGSWVAAAGNPTSFTISFTDGAKIGGGKKSGDTFGIHINHSVVSPPEPNMLPNSTPQPLKGGDVRIN
jgi:hypothetical protein